MKTENQVTNHDDLKHLADVAYNSLDRWKIEIIEFRYDRSRPLPGIDKEIQHIRDLEDKDRPGITSAFHNGWGGGSDACIPNISLERIIRRLRRLEYFDKAEDIQSYLTQLLNQLPSLEMDIDGDYLPQFKAEILDPLQQDLNDLKTFEVEPGTESPKQFQKEAKKPITPIPDGPRPPKSFWWKNEVYNMQPVPYRMLNYMWAKDKAKMQDVIDYVWEKEEISDGTLRTTVSPLPQRTRSFILENM